MCGFDDRDQTHVDWAKAFKGVVTGLQTYVKQYHTTGLFWNPEVSSFGVNGEELLWEILLVVYCVERCIPQIV